MLDFAGLIATAQKQSWALDVRGARVPLDAQPDDLVRLPPRAVRSHRFLGGTPRSRIVYGFIASRLQLYSMLRST